MEEKKKNFFAKHKILTVILVLIILGVIAAATGGDKTTNNQTSKSNGTAQPQEQEAQEPMKITATELIDDFDSNQVAAEKKWKGKFVEFSAEITNITDSGLSFSQVSSSKEFSLAQISCRVKDKQELLPLKNGQTVTVQGIVGSQTIGVIDVSNCEILK